MSREKAQGILSLVACSSLALVFAQAPDARQEVHGYLGRQGFDAARTARLEAGDVIAEAADGKSADREISVVAAVKIRVPRAQVASYYGQMIAYVDGQVTLAFGRFSSPRLDRTLVVQKQLYASHYYDGSLAVATLLDAQDGGRPATYLVYVNRSRGDLLKGGFGGLKRSVARSQARKAAEETLGTIKRVLESQ